MPNRSLIFILLAVVFTVFFIGFIKDTETMVNKSHIVNNNTHKKIPQIKDFTPEITKKLKTIKDNNYSATKEVIPSVYDSDPVVDASLIIENNRLCFNYLESNNQKTSMYIKKFERNLDAKQKSYYQGFYQHCKNLNIQHPEYLLTDIKKVKKQLKRTQSTSTWGKIISKETDVENLNDNEIIGLLKQNDINILTQSQQYLNDYYKRVIHWDLEDVLNNHQYDYTQMIQQYAHQLYLCNLGLDCSPNSTAMASLCYINSQGCGLDYPQYIKATLTTGQQADVQLAIAYLRKIYQ